MHKMRLLIGMCLSLFILLSSFSFGQGGKIKGTIVDANGKAIYLANVVIEGKALGATSDENGFFEIPNVPDGKYRLIFRATGYDNYNIDVVLSGNKVFEINVKLELLKKFDDVVVIGYGTTRTKDLTGAATVVNEKSFLQGSMSSPEQLIMGKVAGLKITSNDGSPGGGSTLRIRGGTSINASNDPLIVVDGVPLDNGGIAGAANPLSLINPNDIASFVVLKDASATAIYGSRAANGVILITTKKGDGLKDSKLKVVFSTKQSISTIAKYADVLSGDSLRNLVNRLGNNTQKALLGTANTDWQKEVFRKAFVTDNNVSLTGGIKGLPYRLSIGNRF